MPAVRTQLPRSLRRGPFTAAEARRAGVSNRALEGPAVHRLFHDVYVDATRTQTLADRVAAALRVLPVGSRCGGVTALQSWGLDLGPRDPLRFWSDWPHQVRRPGLRVSRVLWLPASTDSTDSTLPPALVFRTAATDLGLVDLVAAGDWLVRHRLATPSDLLSVAIPGRGSLLSRRAAGLVRNGVDSPRETWLRLLLVLSGLPEPEVNVAVHHGGRFLGSPDLLSQPWRTVFEYEGDQHRADRRQWSYDVRRYEDFAAAGLTVVRVTAEHVRRPREVLRRAERALRAGGFGGPSADLTEEWRRSFEPLRAHPPLLALNGGSARSQ